MIAGHFTSFHQIHRYHQQRVPSKPLLHCHLFKHSGYDMYKRLLPVQFRGEGLEIYAVPFLQEVLGSCQNVGLHIVPCKVIKRPHGEGPSVRGSVVRLWTCLRGDKGTKMLSVCVLTKN